MRRAAPPDLAPPEAVSASALQAENPADWIDLLRAHRSASQPAKRVDRLQRSTGQTVTRSAVARVARVSTRIARAAAFARGDDSGHGENRSNTARTCENRFGEVRSHGDVVKTDLWNQDGSSTPARAGSQSQQGQCDDGFVSHSFLCSWEMAAGWAPPTG